MAIIICWINDKMIYLIACFTLSSVWALFTSSHWLATVLTRFFIRCSICLRNAVTIISIRLRFKSFCFITLFTCSLLFTYTATRYFTKYTLCIVKIITILTFTYSINRSWIPMVISITFNAIMIWLCLITINTSFIYITRLTNIISVLVSVLFANTWFSILTWFSSWIWTTQASAAIWCTRKTTIYRSRT